HAGAGRSERVTRPDLVDAEIRERRDTTHGRHDGGAGERAAPRVRADRHRHVAPEPRRHVALRVERRHLDRRRDRGARDGTVRLHAEHQLRDRKSTRLNSSHVEISYAVFCLKKKKKKKKKISEINTEK